jgi:microcystin degradation protein MlrC
MRLLIAMMKHETNTFSPLVTDWARFCDWGVQHGEDVVRAYENTAMPVGAYLALAREHGAEVVTPIAAEAMPSGRVTADAYKRLCDPILAEVAKGGFDAALLDLHGAMVSEETDDGEGTLLAAIRRLAPGLPVAVTCDLHCNLTAAMVENCTALIGYKTYPHTDMHVVARQVGRIVLDSLSGKVKPVMAWGKPPLLSQTLRQGTDDEPLKSAMALARRLEGDGQLAATVFGGFALADFRDAGAAAIVVADGDAGRAAAGRDALMQELWTKRADHIYVHRPLRDAVAEAKVATAKGPIVLLDHADNCGSGGTQDVMTVIAEVLRQELNGVVVAAVWDPEAVRIMQKAGIGATVTLDLGGRTDMPSIGERGEPLRLTGKVKALTDGEWVVRGPMYTGVTVRMGPTALLDTGRMRIVITSLHHEPWDQGVFTSVGIQPEHERYLLLKSRIHYRAGFAPIARATFTLDGTGVTTSDNAKLKYEKLRRPIYPLDLVNE